MAEQAREEDRRRREPEAVGSPDSSQGRTREGRFSARSSSRMLSGQMHALRAGFIAVVLWSATFSDTIGLGWRRWAAVVAGYGMAVLVADRVKRVWGKAQGPVALLLLTTDVAFLGWVLYSSGGSLSPLRFLVYIHLIAATLIYTYRVGVLVTVMHSVLFFLLFRWHVADLITVPDLGSTVSGIGESAMGAREAWIFNSVVLWLVAVATAPFSSVNDRELRRRKDDLSELAEMATDFESLHDPKALADSMLDRLCGSFGFGRAAVIAVRGDRLVLIAGRDVDQDVEPTAIIDRLIDKAWDGHDALLVARLDPGSDPLLARLMPQAANLLVAPMFADGQPFGVVVVESAQRDQTVIQRRVISLVMQFASHGALAMRNAWLLQQVQMLADTDALTGVANRRAFEKAIQRDVSRATRSGEQLTLLMVDLDYFKQLNDLFGHQAGDEVLRRVGAVLRTACRESDVPARYGGEEFAVLLPNCRKDEAFAAAQRLRGLIAGIDAPVPISASAGVATYPVNATTPEDLVAAADEALYQSKKMGRNRTTLSPRRVLRAVPDAESPKFEAV